MSKATSAEEKARQREEKNRAYQAFLEKRIPELHEQGVPGRKARTQADMEWGHAQS